MNDLRPKRRLTVLSIAVAAIVGVLVWRLVVIQVVRHERYAARAKGQQVRTCAIPARRGHVFDRNGYPLAVTRWTYTIGVTPEHFPIRNKKAVASLAEACALSKKELLRRLSKARSSYTPLGRDLHLTEEQVSSLSTLAGVRLDPIHDRLYPFASLPAQLLGAIDCAGAGVAGVEAGFQDVLGGADGWFLESRISGDPRGYQPVNGPGSAARPGEDLYLSIDTRVQAIVDFELAEAIDRYRAIGGVAIVADPRTGDILAMAEKPDREIARDRRTADGFALRSINTIYEPGSTFKLITDSYLLESKKVDPYDVFFGENGVWVRDWGVVHDDHKFGWLTFKESFARSSNICTMKAVEGTGREEFYRHILSFGFGGRTGIDLPAESRGTLREPGSWSRRSLSTIAIGHEIGVTPLQMIMAYAAVANGGTLLAPRLALEARVPGGGVARRWEPTAIRRVLSEKTAGTMREFCREVVLSGTGVKAAVAGFEVAGKTGTSQKLANGAYQHDRYVVSFVGYAPARSPRVVCLVILDEPAYPYWWGGESAAVVFGRIMEGMNLSTDCLSLEDAATLAVKRDRGGSVSVPSFLRLTTAEAAVLAESRGLRIECSSMNGIVYSQRPDPGARVRRGERVALMARPERPAAAGVVGVPDLRGLSTREARRMLLGCGLACSVRGFGVVESQDPPTGASLPAGSSVVINCAPRRGEAYIQGTQVANGAAD